MFRREGTFLKPEEAETVEGKYPEARRVREFSVQPYRMWSVCRGGQAKSLLFRRGEHGYNPKGKTERVER